MLPIERPRVRAVYLVLILSVLFAGDAWRFTIGWVAFGVIAVALVGMSVWMLVARSRDWHVARLPYALLAFLALATISLAWSAYPAATALGLATTWSIAIAALALAVGFSWADLLRGLSTLFRFVLVMSLAFELFVSLVIKAPILPFHAQPGVDYSTYDKLPKMLYWSRNELFDVFDQGRIQGIVGNANNLGLIALLALIVFVVQIVDRQVKVLSGLVWVAIAAVTLNFTRSATITVALVGAIAVAGAIVLIRVSQSRRARVTTVVSLGAIVVGGAALALFFGDLVLTVLGKSSDLTGRLGIWEKVLELAQQRPVVGWGWVSYWVPWASPFDNLAFRNGVRQLQAHNAWIDLDFQLGIIGVVLFAILFASAAVRSWLFAVDRPRHGRDLPGRYSAISLLPALFLTVLLIQSLAESRLLVECGFALLLLVAIKTKQGNLTGYEPHR